CSFSKIKFAFINNRLAFGIFINPFHALFFQYLLSLFIGIINANERRYGTSVYPPVFLRSLPSFLTTFTKLTMLIFVVINGFTYSRFVSGSLPFLLKNLRSFVVGYFGTEPRPYTSGLYHVMCGLFLFLTIRTIIFKEITFLSCVIIYLATATYFISIQRTFF